jgi:hypothetical protein
MILPDAENAIVVHDKFVYYLLNAGDPDNEEKALFFLGVGFSPANWSLLAVALRKMAMIQPASKVMASRHGTKYIVDGRIETPSGKMPLARAVWIVDAGLATPRLVTAYPREE